VRSFETGRRQLLVTVAYTIHKWVLWWLPPGWTSSRTGSVLVR